MNSANAMQFKAFIRNRAKKANLPAQVVLQQYMLERLLARIAMSPYRDNLILKGGFLISAIAGIAARTTMDMDITLTGISLTHSAVKEMFESVCNIDADDSISFSVIRTVDIRKDDIYPGVRIHLKAVLNSCEDRKVPNVNLAVDITTGDAITPGQVKFPYRSAFDRDCIISCLAYPISTIIAEKIETILRRAEESTRLRDFYDVHLLYHLHAPSSSELRNALQRTSDHRKSTVAVRDPIPIVERIRTNGPMRKQWKEFQLQYPYAQNISFDDCCSTIIQILQNCSWPEVP